jgi:hypothetical protein
VKNVRIRGVVSLDLSSSSLPRGCKMVSFYLTDILQKILPELREVDISNTDVKSLIRDFSIFFCPLLEKLHHINDNDNNNAEINLCGRDMRFSKNPKEINSMDNAIFSVFFDDEDKIADLNNHQDIFMLYFCCNALEYFSIKNMNYSTTAGFTVMMVKSRFSHKTFLVKSVRNATPTLRRLRSDLTLENMSMLQMERPGIELLN